MCPGASSMPQRVAGWGLRAASARDPKSFQRLAVDLNPQARFLGDRNASVAMLDGSRQKRLADRVLGAIELQHRLGWAQGRRCEGRQHSQGHRQLGAGLGEKGRDGSGAGMTPSAKSPYAGYRFPGEVISHAVWLYFRFPLSLRMV